MADKTLAADMIMTTNFGKDVNVSHFHVDGVVQRLDLHFKIVMGEKVMFVKVLIPNGTDDGTFAPLDGSDPVDVPGMNWAAFAAKSGTLLFDVPAMVAFIDTFITDWEDGTLV